MAKLYWRIKKNSKWTWKPVRGLDQGYTEFLKELELHNLSLWEIVTEWRKE